MSSKNYLDKNGLTYFWGKVKDEVESVRSMCVHITYNNTSEQYESDKTFSEIYSAYENGYDVFADESGLRHVLIYCYYIDDVHGGDAIFSSSQFDNTEEGIVVGGQTITIGRNSEGEYIQVGNYTNTYIPKASTSTDGLPSMDGTANQGDSFNFARADHVHPSDTSKANTSDVLTKTNTTSYTPTADYHPATKKYVDDKEFADLSDVFVIACSVDGSNNHTVDKTWAEITTAINAGKKIFAKHESSVFPLTKFSQSSSSVQGYVAFYSPSPSFNPNLDPYYGGQWRFGEECIVVWDTTWSGQDGEMDSWNIAFMPENIPITTWYKDPNDSNNYCLQTINNDSGGSIFMERYDQNRYSSFVIGSSGINIASTAYDPYGSNTLTMGSSGLSITSTAGVSIQNVVTPTNNTDAATKGYVDNALSGVTTNLAGLTDTTITSPSGGQVLSYDSTNSKWVNADLPSDVMVVKITGTDSNGYTADKTFAEIRAARLAGACVILRYSIYSWYLHAGASMPSSGSDLYFGTLMGGTDYYWKISSANVVTKLTNDFVNTINGQTGNVTLSIPTKTSDLTNDSGYITSSGVPTKTSDLTNDSGFVTTDTNTTYTISISSNVITLTPSTGTAQTITLPVYNGGVT